MRDSKKLENKSEDIIRLQHAKNLEEYDQQIQALATLATDSECP